MLGGWVTSVECIPASGKALPLFVIYKGTNSISDSCVPHRVNVSPWKWGVSNNGWTNNTLSWQWLTGIFKPQT